MPHRNQFNKVKDMKKNNFFLMTAAVAVLMTGFVMLISCDKDDDKKEEEKKEKEKSEYVDLGLTSGTKWKSANEEGLYDYDNTIKLAGDKLPSTEQWEELKNEAIWLWQGDGGFKVTGPNGNSIVLPLTGYRACQGGGVGNVAYYWAIDDDDDRYAPALYMFGGQAYMKSLEHCCGACVRFVQK